MQRFVPTIFAEDERGGKAPNLHDRWIEYAGDATGADASEQDPCWFAWLHHTRDEPPPVLEADPAHRRAHPFYEERPSKNMTGTEHAFDFHPGHRLHPKGWHPYRAEVEEWEPPPEAGRLDLSAFPKPTRSGANLAEIASRGRQAPH
eukprot:tig00001336_g8241.t1